MVKKLHKMAEKQAAASAGLLDNELAKAIKDSAQQIWLAGMGAFAKAQGQGSHVFETLVKEGMGLHKRSQAAAEEKLGEVAGKVTAMADEVTGRAGASWDKLESIFEERTSRALARMGMPTAAELVALRERVDALTAAVERLGGSVAPAKKAARKSAKPAESKAAVAAKPARARPATKTAKAAKPAPAALPPKTATPRRRAARSAA